MNLIVHATNVHQGGGLSLLRALIQHLPENSKLLLDSRFPASGNELNEYSVILVKPTLLNRLIAEWKLKTQASKNSIVICFGNLPPLFSVKGRVVLFIQNRYCVEKNVHLAEFKIKTKIRILVERYWIKRSIKYANKIIVQNTTMYSLVKSRFNINSVILPFVPAVDTVDRVSNFQQTSNSSYDFLYVASGDPHKNHKNLVEAWVQLAKNDIYPSLCLTINTSAYTTLCLWVNNKAMEYKLNIKNLGEINADNIPALLSISKCLIFPSLFESFGLPLIEADIAGLPIVASELDYVRDFVVPKESFDPNSPKSIARAVRRYLGHEEPPLPIFTAKEFIQAALT